MKKDDIQVDVLISTNCIKALEPIKAIPSKAKGPYAYRTVSGWGAVGPVGLNKSNFKEMMCNNAYIHEENTVKRETAL